jgi:hypothetical protein
MLTAAVPGGLAALRAGDRVTHDGLLRLGRLGRWWESSVCPSVRPRSRGLAESPQWHRRLFARG